MGGLTSRTEEATPGFSFTVGQGALLIVSHDATGDRAPAARSVLILVVERNPIVQRLEKFFLEQAGYAVEFASDGVSALARTRELRPAIVISEILVPKMDGLTLCRTVKADPKLCDIIVLLFSHLSPEDRAIEAGADAFLTKPLDDRSLVDTLRKLITKHQESLRSDA